MNYETYKSKLNDLKNHFGNVMALARELSEVSLRIFEQDGNLNYITDLTNAIPTNFGRQTALIKWFKDHSPSVVNFDKNSNTYSWKKDKAENANAFDVEKACQTPFWDYAPDTSVKLFASSDIDKRLLGVIKSFKDEGKNKPMNAKAVQHLAELEQVIQEHAA